jgi:hypothetical protein
LYKAVRTPPMCNGPVGLGAKRTLTSLSMLKSVTDLRSGFHLKIGAKVHNCALICAGFRI